MQLYALSKIVLILKILNSFSEQFELDVKNHTVTDKKYKSSLEKYNINNDKLISPIKTDIKNETTNISSFSNLKNDTTTSKNNFENQTISTADLQTGAQNSTLQIYTNYFMDNNSNNHISILERFYQEFEEDNCLIIPYEDIWLDWAVRVIKIKTIILPNKLKNKLQKFDSYIILIPSGEILKQLLARLYGSLNWNEKAKYLIIYSGKFNNVEDIFKITWRYFILNVIVLTTQSAIELYTHFPYAEGKCGTNLIPRRVSHNSELFSEKVDPDLQGCKVKLMGLNIKPYVLDINEPKDQPTKAGLEVTIIHTILKKMNVSEEYLSNPYSHWGYMLPDGNFTMTFKALHNKEVDIIFGMIIGNETIEEYFDTTVSHIDTAAVWFVPTASQIAQWKNLTVIFNGIVWSSIFVVFTLNAFTFWIIGRKRETIESYKELSLCLMGSLYILLQGSVPSPKTWKLRFIVLIWSFGSLLLFTAYMCQLTGILTSPLYEHQISNLEELVQSKLDYGFYPILQDLYKDPNNMVHKQILHNFKPCSLNTECMNRSAFKRDFALIKNKRQAVYLMPKYYSFSSGKPKLYTFKDSELVVWCKYYVPKGFPILKRIDQLILLLQSNGLIAKWDGDISPRRSEEDDNPELKSLTLNHLQGAFFLLSFGHVIAGFVLFCEIFYNKF